MEALIAVLIAGGLVSMAAHLLRRAQRRAGRADAPRELVEHGLAELSPGDLVPHQEGDLLVRGAAHLREGPAQWREYLLECEGDPRWLIVSPTDTAGALLGRLCTAPEIPDEPPRMLDHDDRIYQLARCGEAEVQIEGSFDGTLTPGRCGYWDYRRPGSGRLWLRRSGHRWLFVVGERIPRHFFTVIPGPG